MNTGVPIWPTALARSWAESRRGASYDHYGPFGVCGAVLDETASLLRHQSSCGQRLQHHRQPQRHDLHLSVSPGAGHRAHLPAADDRPYPGDVG